MQNIHQRFHDRVSIRVDNGVADVRLDRADKLNAIDPAMIAGLIAAGKAVGAHPQVRAVVLSGEGRAFCAGLDFEMFKQMAGQGSEQPQNREQTPRQDREGKGLGSLADRDVGSPANAAQRCAYIWQEIPVPVIAAVHGFAFGGGFQIALGADIRYVASDAQMSAMEIRWGLVPDMSGTQTLRHLVRLDVAKELFFTGRVVNGPEAVQLGLATHLSETPLQDALAAAKVIASKSPDAIRAAKKLLNATVLSTVADGFRLETDLQLSLMGQPNQVEAVMSNLEKREPDFRDPS